MKKSWVGFEFFITQFICANCSLFHIFSFYFENFFVLFHTIFYPLSLSPKGKNKGKLVENYRCIAGTKNISIGSKTYAAARC